MNTSLQDRGKIMRREFDDISARIDHADNYARLAVLKTIARSIGPVRQKYMNASDAGRSDILKVLKKFAKESWKKGDSPSALELSVVALNVESNFVPGPDAALVKTETAILILKAASI